MAIIKIPTPEALAQVFEDYTLAVGKVAYAWNDFHEQLARLFVAVIMAEGTPQTGYAIWYSLDNDRIKRTILKAAIVAAPPVRWENRLTARDDLLWLMEKANGLSTHRDDAVHAPCGAMVSADGLEMASAFFSGHQRAKNLTGKSLLVEFDYCERLAETLSQFTTQSVVALHTSNAPWPDRPSMPTRRPRKALPDRRPPIPPK
jgi:hypothetical protein